MRSSRGDLGAPTESRVFQDCAKVDVVSSPVRVMRRKVVRGSIQSTPSIRNQVVLQWFSAN